MDAQLFSRSALEVLADGERAARLSRLSDELALRLAGAPDAETFFATARILIGELRDVGHDLWSLDADGESWETWGGDYTRPHLAGPLVVTFHWHGDVRVEWQARPSRAF